MQSAKSFSGSFVLISLASGGAKLQAPVQWKAEERSIFSIQCDKMFYVNRDNAMKQLKEAHSRTFHRAERKAGLDWIIPICDNMFGLGKSELSCQYISWCMEDWKVHSGKADHRKWTIAEWGQERSRRRVTVEETLSQCYTVQIDLKGGCLRNPWAFDAVMLAKLQLALIPKFITPPKCLFRFYKFTTELLTQLIEEVGPIFVALDEIGEAFKCDGRGVLEEREMFLKFCENVLQAWLSIPGLFILVIGRGAFLNYVGARPTSMGSIVHGKSLQSSPCLFQRLSLRFLTTNYIVEILRKTLVYESENTTLVDYFELDAEKTTQVANHLFQQTSGHPRELIKALKSSHSFEDLMRYTTQYPILKAKDLFDFVLMHKTHMDRIFDAAESNQLLDLSENVGINGIHLPMEILVNNAFIAWDGNLEEARLFPSPPFKNFMASYFMPFRNYLQLISRSIRSGLMLDFSRTFEIMVAKRFQEMFSRKQCPRNVLRPFLDTPVFGVMENIKLHYELCPMPQINAGGIGVSLNAATADVANWPALWKEIFEKVDMQGSLSLKAPDRSASPDVIFAGRMTNASVLQDFILGLAIKNYNPKTPSVVGNTMIKSEIKKFSDMFQPHDSERIQQCVKVLVVCATSYIGDIRSRFGDRKFFSERNGSENIDELIVLDLCTSSSRAEFFGLNQSDSLAQTIEDVVAKVSVLQNP